MTCIAAKIYPATKHRPGRVDFVCESLATIGKGLCVVDTRPKVVQVPGWGLVGSSGDDGATLRAWPLFATCPDIERLIDRIRGEKITGCDWLFYRDGLVWLDTDGAMTRPPGLFYAIGSGGGHALAAMRARASPRRAVEIACIDRTDCGGPIISQSMPI